MASEGYVKRAMERQNAAASQPAPQESVSTDQTQSHLLVEMLIGAGAKKRANIDRTRDEVKKPVEYDRTLILNHAYMR